MTANYKCCKCEFEWSTQVQGGRPPLKQPHSDECPRCQNEYFRWTNFEEVKLNV